MDRIGGWEEENWVGARFAACMWSTQESSDMQWSKNNVQNYRLLIFRSILDAVNWVCDGALDDHVWVSELTLSCQEAKVL